MRFVKFVCIAFLFTAPLFADGSSGSETPETQEIRVTEIKTCYRSVFYKMLADYGGLGFKLFADFFGPEWCHTTIQEEVVTNSSS